MICGVEATFRLLDHLVGWEYPIRSPFCDLVKLCKRQGSHPGSLIFDDDEGLRVDLPTADHVPLQSIASYLPPAWLANATTHGEWYACGVNQDQHSARKPFVLHRDPCNDSWRSLMPSLQGGNQICNPIAVATGTRRLTILDQHDNTLRLFVWSVPDGRLVGFNSCRYLLNRSYAVAVTDWREIVAVHLDASGNLHFDRFDLSGQQHREFNSELKLDGDLSSLSLRLSNGKFGDLILACGQKLDSTPEPVFRIFSIRPEAPPNSIGCDQSTVLSVEDLSTLLAANPESIGERVCVTTARWEQDDCVGIDFSDRFDQERIECICRSGSLKNRKYKTPRYPNVCGELILGPVESYLQRCIWHRVRAEIDFQDEGEFQIEVQSSDESEPSKLQPAFWKAADQNSDDFLIDQPAARNLFLRIRIVARRRSPVIRRLRIDFPRVTSLDSLPAVYRQDPHAEDFTARFLSLFDAEMELLDRVIEDLPSLFEIQSTPNELLPWLADFLAIGLDGSWSEAQRRQILAAAPDLYKRRGTVQGLKQTLALVFKLEPNEIVIQERAHGRCFGIAGHNARLGQTRLFGKRNSRIRLGTSALGVAGLNTYGNPDEDFVRQDAHQFDVLVPPLGGDRDEMHHRIEAVVDSLKPAHTQHTLRIGGECFVLGHRSVIGIDTQFIAPGEIVLAKSSDGDTSNGIRLGEGVLRPGPNRPTSGLNLGVTSNIGIHTTLE